MGQFKRTVLTQILPCHSLDPTPQVSVSQENNTILHQDHADPLLQRIQCPVAPQQTVPSPAALSWRVPWWNWIW